MLKWDDALDERPNTIDIDALQAKLARALERETALREILDAISASRADEAVVFETILRNAAMLCDAPIARLEIANEARTHFKITAAWGSDLRKLKIGDEFSIDLPLIVPTTIREARSFHIPDLADTEGYRNREPLRVVLVEEEGIRTYLTVPLIRDGVGIGCIVLSRREVKPFADDDIAVVTTFAEQAVIAIENARQNRAVQTRLECERATSEILEIISQSRDDELPVFRAILDRAERLCGADGSGLQLLNPAGTHLEIAAIGSWDEKGSFPIGTAFDITAPLGMCIAVNEGRVVHYEDLKETELYKQGHEGRRKLVDAEEVRTHLNVPLIQGGTAFGNITLSRREQKAFSADEIALVETFAAQAVIAIENVRQFREVQTRLAREAATREVLEVISQSRDDDQPVFDLILKKAAELCGAFAAALAMGKKGDTHQRLVASYYVSPETIAVYDSGQVSMDPDISLAAKAILSGKPVHVEDMADTEGYRSGVSHFTTVVEHTGIRTNLFVPLMTPDGGIGVLILFRKEVRSYTPDEISLVETFAAQAVIAVENVGQFREVQTRLERETATSEVLSVISQSRSDDVPVFEAILKNAQALCGAPMSALILARKGDALQTLAAQRGVSENSLDLFRKGKMPLDGDVSYAGRCILEGRLVAFSDMEQSYLYKANSPVVRSMVDDTGIRSVLFVPLMKDEAAIGCITLFRLAVQPFEERHIELVKTFAAQAVIAIENVRQFRELQTRLDREGATREILEVISQSRDDDQPVFDAILSRAAHLCAAPMASLNIVNDERTHMKMLAHWGDQLQHLAVDQTVWPLDSGLATVEVFHTKKMVHIADLKDTDLYRAGDIVRTEVVDKEGVRTFLALPLLSKGEVIGNIAVYKREAKPFSDDDILLLKTFAEQAVIAIENVRQFKALETLNAELGERVEEQVGEIERMGRLKRFLPAAVADTVVSQGSEKLLASHRALLGVLFCDIRGFTAFCETAEPEETIEVLQSYHEEMGALIAAHGAGVDTRAGDGIMVLFNDPLPCDDPAGDALRLGLAMRARMEEMCKSWRRHGHKLGFGVGISLGYATVGMVGSSGRYDYTASGTAVNLAARLCDKAEDGEILLSPRAYTAVEDAFTAEPIGEIALKGIHAPVDVFRVTGLD